MKSKKESKRYSNEDIKAFFEHIKDYFKSLYDKHEPLRITLLFILLYTAAFAVDEVNLPTKLINKFGKDLFFGVLCGLLFAGFVLLFQKHWIDLLKEKTVNDIDRTLIVSFIFDLPVLIYWLIKYGVSYCKVILLLGATLTLFGFICYRIIITFNKNSNNSVLSNVYELQDIFKQSVQRKANIPILISEKDVDYDLFKRNDIINHICSSIKACYNAENSFVIGLDGPWGSGKTTLLNNVKKLLKTEKDIEIIDDFDLWTYNTQESLLFALLDTILSHTGVKYSYISTKKMINQVRTSIIGNNAIGGSAIGILNNYNSNDVVNSLKEKINKHLEVNNKTVLIIIDNIDRASADNILFLFKLIGNIFDLKRIVYVLSYDSTRTKKILKDNLEIDENYIEKIIQQEISVPSINKESLNRVFETCLKNLLLSYGVQNENLSEYQYIIDFIINNTKNIREFKRLINSAFSIVFADDNLYKPDLLTLEIIRFLDNELYDEIKRNIRFFVDYDFDVVYFGISYASDDEKEKQELNFYDILLKKYNKQLIILVSFVFSKVKLYLEKTNTYENIRPMYNDYKTSLLKCKADSAKYFDLYFSYGDNKYSKISKTYNDFCLNVKNNSDKIIHIVDLLFKELPEVSCEEFLERLWYNRSDFTPKQSYYLFKGLLNNMRNIDDTSIMIHSRIIEIMLSLFKAMDKNQKEQSVRSFNNKYIHLHLLDDIIIYAEEKEEDFNILKSTLDRMCEDVFNNNISIYSSENYRKFNVLVLFKYKKDKYGCNEIKSYISKIIKPKYIYKMLLDCIGAFFLEDKYVYAIKKEYFGRIFESTDIVNECIEKYKPTNEKEQFILDVYKTFINPVCEDILDNGLKVNEYIDL